MNIISRFVNTYNRMLWKSIKRKLKFAGKNCRMGRGFSIREPQYISIGDDFEGGKDVAIHAWKHYRGYTTLKDPEIIIGNNVSVTKDCYISCLDKVVIGDGTLIGVGAFISDNAHGKNTLKDLELPPNQRALFSKGPVVIGKNVWIGRNVCVMPGVTIGDYAVIGANAVVTYDIPPRSVAVGVPAKVIKIEGQTCDAHS